MGMSRNLCRICHSVWSSEADVIVVCFFFSSRRRHTRCSRDWSSDVCSSDLGWTESERPAYGRREFPVPLLFWDRRKLSCLSAKMTNYMSDPAFLMAKSEDVGDRKSTRLNSSHGYISYAVFCLKKKIHTYIRS